MRVTWFLVAVLWEQGSAKHINAEEWPCVFFPHRSYFCFSSSLLVLSQRDSFFRCPADSHLCENMSSAHRWRSMLEMISCHAVSTRSQHGTLKGDTPCTLVSGWAELFCRDRGLAVEKENVNIHVVWRTSGNSVCRYLCLIQYIVCVCLKGCPCRQISPADLCGSYCTPINRPLVLFEGELSYVHETWLCCCYAKDIWIFGGGTFHHHRFDCKLICVILNCIHCFQFSDYVSHMMNDQKWCSDSFQNLP